MAMEFIDGLTLRELIDNRRKLPLDVALAVAWGVVEALRHAHLHGIVHRDVKPANIMVSHTGQVRLLDFGVARFESQADLTMPGMVVGTTSYMSAEQAKGEIVDERSDLYSLGLCIYEALTGTHPFRKDTPEATLTALLTQRARPLWVALPGTPLSIAFLFSATMSRNKERRPRDASAFLSRLDRAWGRAGRDREAYLAAFMAAIRSGRPFASQLPKRGPSLLLAVFVAFSTGAAAVGLLLALRLMR
jgi:serine/threonine-protein kinase